MIATIVATAAASTASARPVFDRLAPSNSSVPSQDRFVGVDTRAADDLILPLGNGHPHRVQYIQVEMIGNGVPALAKFGVTIFTNNAAVPFGQPGGSMMLGNGASAGAPDRSA